MRKSSSIRWLKEHFDDVYIKKAHKDGYRSRAVYKLLEMHEKNHLFKAGMKVIDLGSSPGSWSQLLIQLVNPKGKVIALDLLQMAPIEDVVFIQGDFREDATLNKLRSHISTGFDWVISDMSPNVSGNECIDAPRSIYLAELVFAFAKEILKPGGGLLIKVFQGSGFESFFKQVKGNFNKVIIRKPKASRNRSKEIYILAQGHR